MNYRKKYRNASTIGRGVVLTAFICLSALSRITWKIMHIFQKISVTGTQ